MWLIIHFMYHVFHMHLIYPLNIYHIQLLQSTNQCKKLTNSKFMAAAHRYCLVQPYVLSRMVHPLMSTLCLSIKIRTKLIFSCVLLLHFTSIHQRIVSESVLQFFFCSLTYFLDWGRTGNCIINWKLPRTSKVFRRDFIIKIKS